MTRLHLYEMSEQKTNLWLKRITEYAGWQTQEESLAALRASLQTLRDQMQVDDMAHLAPQLPVLIRGLFYENWHPANTPEKARHVEDFLAAMEEKLTTHPNMDATIAIGAVMITLRKFIDPNEFEKIKGLFSSQIRDFLFSASQEVA